MTIEREKKNYNYIIIKSRENHQKCGIFSRIIFTHVIHDNFGRESLNQCARVGFRNAKRCTIEQLIVLRNNRSGWQQSSKPYLQRRKKNRKGSRNPATTTMEFYVTMILDLRLKRNQRIYRHTCHSKKNYFLYWDT